MIKQNTVYSIDEVAEACCVRLRTAIDWFDKGLIKGYRVPGCQERRVPHERLIEFMKERGLGIPEELKDADETKEATGAS
jgi:hypothetical protein